MRLSVVVSAVVAALVGFGGTLAIVVSAAKAVGADAAQTSSWVTGLCLAMAATSTILSLRHRIPIITAWSPPGAALLAAAFRPLGALIGRIPTPVAAAMLAGVLIRFVLATFDSAQHAPALVWPL